MRKPVRIYLHGLPGSPRELTLFGSNYIKSFDWAPDRSVLTTKPERPDYFDQVTDAVVTRFPDCEIHLTGFSLGAAAAMQIASRLGERITGLDLISAAAPLELGNFLPDMAGRAVFRLAQDSPRSFQLLRAIQSVMASLAPSTLARMLFASACGDDVKLGECPQFRKNMSDILQQTFVKGAFAYETEIQLYVRPWASCLMSIHCPVRLWHGTQDNWCPPAMAEAIRTALPLSASIHWINGASHYSTLTEALERIVSIQTTRDGS